MARSRVMADGRKAAAFYIDVELDDAGLTASQYRVYARIVRRAGESTCFESIENMATGCRLEKKTILQCLRDLLQVNLIRKVRRLGFTSEYTLVDKSEWLLDRLNRRERGRTPPNQHPTQSAPQGLTQSAPHPVNPISTPQRIPIEDIPIKRLSASPQLAVDRVGCPKCKQKIKVLSSAGKPVAPCLTCNIDALIKPVTDLKSDAAKCMAFYKLSYTDLFGVEPHVTKGKDFGIMANLVETYGKEKVQGFIKAYLNGKDEVVRQAGYSIAFFSTRINSLIVAGVHKSQPHRQVIVT